MNPSGEPSPHRRSFLRRTGLGLAAASGWVLRADAQPTPSLVRKSEEHGDLVAIQMETLPLSPRGAEGELRSTAPFPYGPFYKPGAPFRGKLSLPGEPGVPFVLRGRVWDLATRSPVPGAVLEFWHVDTSEHYSNGVDDLRNRGRLVSSEQGAYELESIRPIPYRPDPVGSPNFFRCAHFHLYVRCPGYAPLITEIHFREEAHKEDGMYQPLNAIAVEKHKLSGGASFESGVFDIVLVPEQ